MINPLYLFSLEVLDTRLIPESHDKLNQNKRNATQSRWRTPEFFVYYIIFVAVVPQMFLAAMSASNEKSVNYHLYEDKLAQGWILGRKVDNSDAQYAGFRNKLPILAGAVVLHYVLRRTANALRIRRLLFDVGFAAIFLAVLHGFSTVKILAIYVVNFLISKSFNKRAGMIVTWIFNIIILFLNEWYEGYKFGSVIPGLGILDIYCGLLPRWDVNFNFSVLRMISYNYDYYESLANPNDIEKKHLDDAVSESDRISIGPPNADYNFFNYIAYLVYTPLYIAGPILTFNDFIYQSKHSLPSVSQKRTLLYGLRVLACILVMEWLLHYMYVVALSSVGVWEGLSALQISMVGFFNLKTIWLKLLIPWRFFRLWALLDQIDPPENMIRCMSNNYSASAFWRAWHKSYHRWVIRYLYVPLGGAKHPIRNMLIVFTFVAFWHDIQLRLLAWGWLITLFVVPEVAAKLVFPAKKWRSRPIYRHMCAIGAVSNIYMMMLANLVGFAVGIDGLRDMLRDIFSSWTGIPYFLFTSACLFVGVQIMFEVRAQEARQGINLRC
ncbi:MBOAT, membrane-bound O-acyltransferase family-domain-containing protein [Lipomyces chichibuensis]|uniref:MBOAT, membrane-bound O-acyltransferase family-domain-containing protein n=1 Tax=Lipomyces chichibuensis TaxID=1546026 RepID=UPI003343BC6B